MHEVGHAIFEAPYAGAALDFTSKRENSESVEVRAQGFAQEALVPREVLVHLAQKNALKWSNMSGRGLASIVAQSHVELRTVITAALDAELIGSEEASRLATVDISADLPELSTHALSTENIWKLSALSNVRGSESELQRCHLEVFGCR